MTAGTKRSEAAKARIRALAVAACRAAAPAPGLAATFPDLELPAHGAAGARALTARPAGLK